MMYNGFKAIAESCVTLQQLKNALDEIGMRSIIVNGKTELWAGREVRYGHMTRWEQWTATIKDGKITTWCCP